MKTVVYKSKVLKIYNSIEELPIMRFQKYNKFLLLDAALGSDLNDLNLRIEKAIRYLNVDKEAAVTELRNLQQSIHLINSELSPKHLAFATLVFSINGKEVTGSSDDTFKGVLKSLEDIPHSFIDRLFQAVKKKIDEQLEAYFPQVLNTGKEKKFYELIKIRALLQLRQIADKEDNNARIEAIENEMLIQNKPKSFTEAYNSEIEFEKDFNKSLVLIKDMLHLDARDLSTLAYYNALDYLKTKNNGTRRPD